MPRNVSRYDSLLAATDATERHLFVWIHGSAAMAHAAMSSAMHPPTETDDLGDGIDVLWVGLQDHAAEPVAVVLWRATSGAVWQDWTHRVQR